MYLYSIYIKLECYRIIIVCHCYLMYLRFICIVCVLLSCFYLFVFAIVMYCYIPITTIVITITAAGKGGSEKRKSINEGRTHLGVSDKRKSSNEGRTQSCALLRKPTTLSCGKRLGWVKWVQNIVVLRRPVFRKTRAI